MAFIRVRYKQQPKRQQYELIMTKGKGTVLVSVDGTLHNKSIESRRPFVWETLQRPIGKKYHLRVSFLPHINARLVGPYNMILLHMDLENQPTSHDGPFVAVCSRLPRAYFAAHAFNNRMKDGRR